MHVVKSIAILAIVTLSIVSVAHGQRYQGNVQFQPPSGAFFGYDMDKWDEIRCDTAVRTISGESRFYDYKLSREKLLETPKWNPLADPPGVTTENAVRLANKKLATIKPFGDCESILVEVRMQSYWDRWVWAVIFKPKPKDDQPNSEERFPVFVLMDGTTLEPDATTPNYLSSDSEGKRR